MLRVGVTHDKGWRSVPEEHPMKREEQKSSSKYVETIMSVRETF
jgi:hypothetical protein